MPFLLICMLRQVSYGLEVVLSSYVWCMKEIKAMNMKMLFFIFRPAMNSVFARQI